MVVPWFDLAILGLLLISASIGVMRGLVSEVLALIAWVIAFLVARTGSPSLAHLFSTWLDEPILRQLAAFAGLFLITLLLLAALRWFISHLLRAIGLGPLDRMLGACFGFARGLLILWCGVLLAGLTSLPSTSSWQTARLIPPLETAVIASKPWLPAALAQKIDYRPPATRQAGRRSPNTS